MSEITKEEQYKSLMDEIKKHAKMSPAFKKYVEDSIKIIENTQQSELPSEQWKPIIGYEGIYEISSNSNVRSLDRKIICGDHMRNLKGTIMRKGKIKGGYNTVHLSKNGENKSFKVSRLVAQHFVPNPDNKEFVNHKNSITNDDNANNLEWCTFQENIDHAKVNRLFTQNKEITLIDENNQEHNFTSMKDASLYLDRNKRYVAYIRRNGFKITDSNGKEYKIKVLEGKLNG